MKAIRVLGGFLLISSAGFGQTLYVPGGASTGIGTSTTANVGIGTATPHAPLQFSNSLTNRKIILYEAGNNDHGFYGFGVNAGLLRYQIGSTADSHVFYAHTSPTTSIELMRLTGDGKLGIGINPDYKLHVFVNNGSGTDTDFIKLGDTFSNRSIRIGAGDNHAYIQSKANHSDVVTNLTLQPAGGNLGLGTVVPGSHASYVQQFNGKSQTLMAVRNGTEGYIASNTYYDGSWKKHVTGASSMIAQSAGAISFYTNTSGATNSIITWGPPKMFIADDGNLGIGTTNPVFKLDVQGSLRTTDYINATQYITVMKNGSYRVAMNGQGHGYIVGRNDDVVEKFAIRSNGVTFFNGGNVGIGTSTPDYKLTVDGNVKCEEVKVEVFTGTGPDYVFEKDYNLLSLSEVESHIKQHNHLPEVPSAKEMEHKGLNLKEMNLILLKKVEELTLHLIEQGKINSEQQDKIKSLSSRIADLENK